MGGGLVPAFVYGLAIGFACGAILSWLVYLLAVGLEALRADDREMR